MQQIKSDLYTIVLLLAIFSTFCKAFAEGADSNNAKISVGKLGSHMTAGIATTQLLDNGRHVQASQVKEGIMQ